MGHLGQIGLFSFPEDQIQVMGDWGVRYGSHVWARREGNMHGFCFMLNFINLFIQEMPGH